MEPIPYQSLLGQFWLVPVILLVLLCVFAQVSPTISETPGAALKGDVNQDTVVDQVDAQLILQMFTRQLPDQDVKVAADVNQDNRIGLAEAVYALQIPSILPMVQRGLI